MLNVALVIIACVVAIGVVGAVGVGTLETLCTDIFVVPLGHTLNFLSKDILFCIKHQKNLKHDFLFLSADILR